MTSKQNTQTTVLPNGLKVATNTMPHAHSVAISIGVNVGARYEDEPVNGISHMLEHMAFKGTARRTAQEIAETFDAIGGNLNAYTSMEHTVYYARVLKENLGTAVDVLADILQHSTFVQEELERERLVILQEVAMHHDTPDDVIFDRFTECAYPGQAIGRSILGTEEKIKHFSRDHLQTYTAAHYTAPRMAVSAAGNVNHEDFVRRIEDAFTSLRPSKAHTPPKAVYEGGEDLFSKKLEQLHLLVGFPAASYHDDDYRTQQVLSTLLGGGMSSRLFQEVREKRGLAYSIYAFLTAYADSGLFGVYAGTSQKDAREVMNIVADEMQKLTAAAVGMKELERAKIQLKAGILMAQESVSSQSDTICRHLLSYGRVKTVDEMLASIDAVTPERLTRTVQKFLMSKPTVSAIGPVKGMPKYDDVCDRLAA